MELNQKNLSEIAIRIPGPTYNRNSLKTGIVHIGVGGFHRSHQAYYIHQLLEKHKLLDWGICGIGIREAARKMNTVLKKQDCLYTLITQHPDGFDNYEIIGSIGEFLLAVDSSKLVIQKMVHPDTKIVSLTITEGGYNFDPVSGNFNFNNPDVQHELANPDEPKTVYGYLAAALRERYENGIKPFTVMSCDNIQHNGDVIRKMLLTFTKEQDAELAKWIESEVSFPNSMVDRITPVTTPAITYTLKEKYHIKDEWCVVCEPYIQWVIEDKFCNGRPPLEKLGVQFVSDVTPYEKMKIRLLNAGHSVIGITGAIHGHPSINACMEDAIFKKFMRQFMDEEVTPILGLIEGIDIENYKDILEERFANPNIKDSVSRICSESSAKLPKFLIPTLKDNLQNNGSIKYATFILAAWCYYSDKGIDEKGKAIEIVDEQKESLHKLARGTKNNWDAFLNQPKLFGDLIKNERFKKKYIEIVKTIYDEENIRELMNRL
ncbi:MAG: mannitol dehydrogenase family protein [Bacteroidota bacterium]